MSCRNCKNLGLRLNEAKRKFFQNKLEFLGHVVTPAGTHPTDQRIDNILKALTPTCKSQLKSFLGFMTYNAKFLSSVASVLYPLYRLLRKDSRWKCTDTCQETFEKAKVLVSRSPGLVHYDVHKPLKLYCDASPNGVGACLMHVIDGVEKPVALASCRLSVAQQNYAQVEREAPGIISGVKRFNQYLCIWL